MKRGEKMEARANHILVATEQQCKDLKARIEKGEITFAKAARKFSKCPSGSSGGDLGTFGRGQMVPEFDEVVFSAEVGKVHGPVKTDFGYHLIQIVERSE